MTGLVKYAVVKHGGHSKLPLGQPVHMRCTYQYNESYAKKHFSFGEIDPAELDGKRCGLCNDDWIEGPHRLAPLGTPPGCSCLNCGPKPQVAPMNMVIAVGFGMAGVTRDGDWVLDGEERADSNNMLRVSEAEELAAADPDHDWRIVLDGPLGGVVYQRHGVAEWVACINLPGFA